jgi:hypothetical protein
MRRLRDLGGIGKTLPKYRRAEFVAIAYDACRWSGSQNEELIEREVD